VAQASRTKRAVALIEVQDSDAEFVGHVEVWLAVVVGVEPKRRERRAVSAIHAGTGGHVFELPVAQIAEQQVAPAGGLAALAIQPGTGFPLAWLKHVAIDTPVPIVVRYGHPGGVEREPQIRSRSHVAEALALLVTEYVLA